MSPTKKEELECLEKAKWDIQCKARLANFFTLLIPIALIICNQVYLGAIVYLVGTWFIRGEMIHLNDFHSLQSKLSFELLEQQIKNLQLSSSEGSDEN